jgi:type I restriction enzyme M protein
MLTGEIRGQIDSIWNAFWTGGISNPLEVIEQITYLLFLRRLDELDTLEELKATRLKQPVARRIFPEGQDGHSQPRPYADYRWTRFKNFEPRDMFVLVSEHVFPFVRKIVVYG